jgi:hypothetical protein
MERTIAKFAAALKAPTARAWRSLGGARAPGRARAFGYNRLPTHFRAARRARKSSAMPLDAVNADVKAQILAEALPYIRRFHDRTIVVKYGGNAMTESAPQGRLRARRRDAEARRHESR